MTKHPITPSQTIGPFPHDGWRWAVQASAAAAPLVIEGTLLDGDGCAVDDGWIEAWVPSGAAADAQRALAGFRRAPTGEGGAFRLELPAAAAGEPAAWITVFARGLLVHRFSAVFLEDASLAGSPLLAQVPVPRRATLIARREAGGAYRWDVRLQGEQETVFFDFE